MNATRGMLVGLNTSQSEKEYTRLGINMGIRPDGRSWLDYRNITVQGEVLPQANGSARITIAHGGTEVLASVKLETGTPSLDAPRKGKFEVNVECSNSLFRTFDDRGGEEVNVLLTKILMRTIAESDALDLDSLCIIPGKFCWIIYLDLLILQADGNLLDAASFAGYLAINTSIVPNTILIVREGDGEAEDFEIEGDLANSKFIEGATKLPICISLSRIGNHFLVDTSIDEESCVEARVVVGVGRDGTICGIHKQGLGTLPPQHLSEMAQCATGLAASILKVLDECIASVKSDRGSSKTRQMEAFSTFMD